MRGSTVYLQFPDYLKTKPSQQKHSKYSISYPIQRRVQDCMFLHADLQTSGPTHLFAPWGVINFSPEAQPPPDCRESSSGE